jgi:hypothetical protein
MPRTNRIGITIGGTRYFMGLSVEKRLSLPAPIPVLGRPGYRRSGLQPANEDCHPKGEAAEQQYGLHKFRAVRTCLLPTRRGGHRLFWQ